MSTSTDEVDIGLYSEDIDQDFISEEDIKCEAVDLYDAVIMNSLEVVEGGDPSFSESTPTTPSSKPSKEGQQPLKKKHQACVGNLTWWTTDKDIEENLKNIGVKDFEEVKFYENRNNGQSKGYCMVTVGSEVSITLIHEKLLKNKIHGQLPIVTPPTKQALNHFESQVKTRPPPTPPQGNQCNGNWNGMGVPVASPRMGVMGYNGPREVIVRCGPRMPMGMGMPPRHLYPQQCSPGNRNRHPMMGMPLPPPHPGHPLGLNRASRPPVRPIHPPPMMDHQGHPASPRDWNRPPVNDYSPRGQGPLPHPCLGPRPGPHMNGPPPPFPAPHMNPAFFNSSARPEGGPRQSSPMYATSHSGRHHSGGTSSPPVSRKSREQSPISEDDSEEAMSRNRIVSSSAICRAVSDAESGEYASAIETLVTAISLLKASKVAHLDRCRVLIGSLQDALFGIEANSYGQGRSERSRSSAEHRRFKRERSRSRSRDKRSRSRERRSRSREKRSRSKERRSRSRERRSRSRERRDYRNLSRERMEYYRNVSRSPVEREYEARRESRSSRSRYYEKRERSGERDSRVRDRDRTRGESEREREPSERSDTH